MLNPGEHSFFSSEARSRSNSSSVVPIISSSQQSSPRVRTLSLSLVSRSYADVPPLSFFNREETLAFSLQDAPSPIARELAQTLLNIERTIEMIAPLNLENQEVRAHVESLHEINEFFQSLHTVLPSAVLAADRAERNGNTELQSSEQLDENFILENQERLSACEQTSDSDGNEDDMEEMFYLEL